MVGPLPQISPRPQTQSMSSPFDYNWFLTIQTDFAKIYRLLATLFDRTETNYIAKLNELDPADRETAQILMHNLAVNLSNRNFMDCHQSLMQQHASLGTSPSLSPAQVLTHTNDQPSPTGSITPSDSPDYSDTNFLVSSVEL